MKIRLHAIFRPYMSPAGDDGSAGGGGEVDRGDNFVPTGADATVDDDAAAAAAASAEAAAKAKLAAKGADAQKTPEELAAEELAAEEAAAEAAAAEAEAAGKGDKGKDGKDGKGKDTRVPLSRHKEILDKERERREALEREVATLKAGQAVTKTNEDITKIEDSVLVMEKDYLQLLADGKVPEAAAKMVEIRKAERAIGQANTLMQTQAAEARAYERVKYDTTVERLEAAYPVINPDHDDYDSAQTKEVIELRDGYVATGKYSRAEALQKACKQLLKTATVKQETATEVDVRVDKDEVAKQVAADRKAAAVKKALETSGKSPPNAANLGQDSDKTGGKLKGSDVIKMNQADFAKLSDADLSELRGDTVT